MKKPKHKMLYNLKNFLVPNYSRLNHKKILLILVLIHRTELIYDLIKCIQPEDK